MHARLRLGVDIALGGAVFLLAWWLDGAGGGPARLLLTAGPAVAAALAGRRASWALALVWVVALLQVAATTVVPSSWIALPFVAYRIARHGPRRVVWAAGVSVPLGAVAGVVVAAAHPVALQGASVLPQLVRASGTGLASAVVALAAINGAPFALGLVVRVSEGYRRAEERAAAEHELAQAREAQNRLAYDVHDIVGHSLAVIIAQADAAQLAAEDDGVRTALAQISAAGRSSLAEVRDVLARDRPAEEPARTPELDELVAGVRAGGTAVVERVSGEPAPLAEPAGGASYRVLQELLTNALKHGVPGGPVEVERVWAPPGLTLRVTNPVLSDAAEGNGMGLAGVRTRVDGVGGTFRAGRSGDRFVATAFLPAGRR